MRTLKLFSCTLAATIALAAGCRHGDTVNKDDFKTSLNDFYRTRQVCLWDGSIKLPAQADTNNDQETKQFDALTDAGLFQRTPAEKKRFLIGSKSVTNYDLTANGRSYWTANSAQPGYGNFCLGTRKVDSITAYSPSEPGASQYSVSFHYSVTAPTWANNPEIKTAFPQVGRAIEGTDGSATMSKIDAGWQVGNVKD